MAKPQKAKKAAPSTPSSSGRALRNGRTKAWKQGKHPDERPQKPKVRTPERKAKDEMIVEFRLRRKEENIERRRREKEAEEALRAERAAELQAEFEAAVQMIAKQEENKKRKKRFQAALATA